MKGANSDGDILRPVHGSRLPSPNKSDPHQGKVGSLDLVQDDYDGVATYRQGKHSLTKTDEFPERQRRFTVPGTG